MKKILFLTILITLALSQQMFACECAERPPFLTVAPKTEMIALVKVERYLTFKDIYDKPIPMSMETQIIDLYQGKEEQKKVVVWGDNGFSCRPYLSQFEVGKYYVIGFFRASKTLRPPAEKEEKPTDYSISFCGEYWLSVEKGIAKGKIAEGIENISLDELKSKIQKTQIASSILQSNFTEKFWFEYPIFCQN